MQIVNRNGSEFIKVGGSVFPAIGLPDDHPATTPANDVHGVIFCRQDNLRLHPDNMRRYYPPEQVAEMAESIRAAGGVLQALLVVPIREQPGCYLVVDGNMRLSGARLLGDDCPLLKCEVIEADRARQLLVMAITSRIHYPKDPISEARHYRRLMVEEGYSKRDIARHIGVNEGTVSARLKLLELDEPIQRDVANGSLPKDTKLVDALMAIPEPVIRVDLARRLASNPRTTAKSAIAAALKVAEQVGRPVRAKKPALTLDISLFTRLTGNVIVELERDAALLEMCADMLIGYGEVALGETAMARARKNRRLRLIAKGELSEVNR